MKPLADIKLKERVVPSEHTLWQLVEWNYKLDFDVFLPTYGKNLQRGLVWTLLQKRELIVSVLLERYVPPVTVIACVDYKDTSHISKDIYQVIDGKQRLTTLISFLKDEFTVELEEEEYLFSQLPKEYQYAISNYYVRFGVIYEPYGKPFSDKFKLEIFKHLNFKATPQDENYYNSFEAAENE